MPAARFVLITGVTRGLGRAMVEEFIRLGHTIAGCGRSKSAIAELSRKFPAPHAFTALDVASDAEVRAWAKAVFKDLGVPDLLLNNATVINQNARLWQVGAQEFDQLIDVNIKGVANVIRHFVPAM